MKNYHKQAIATALKAIKNAAEMLALQEAAQANLNTAFSALTDAFPDIADSLTASKVEHKHQMTLTFTA